MEQIEDLKLETKNKVKVDQRRKIKAIFEKSFWFSKMALNKSRSGFSNDFTQLGQVVAAYAFKLQPELLGI